MYFGNFNKAISKKSKGKHMTKKQRELHEDIQNSFQLYDQFIKRSVLPSYFIKFDQLENLSIYSKTLRSLLDDISWKNVLVLKERVYPNLVLVFYSNMLIFTNTSNRISINVAGIPIKFNIELLNMILRTRNDGLYLYTSKYKIDYPRYSIGDVVRNIYRHSNLSKKFYNSSFKSQVLPFKFGSFILRSVLQHVISPHMRYGNDVTNLDVALLSSILEGRKPNIRYIIIQHIFSTLRYRKLIISIWQQHYLYYSAFLSPFQLNHLLLNPNIRGQGHCQFRVQLGR